MSNRKTRAAIALAATVGLAVPATAPHAVADDDAADRARTRSLATVLQADGNRFDRNWGDFDVLHRAVTRVLADKPSSAVKVLADGDRALTAFLPTDRAFRRLVFQLTGHRPHSEKGTFHRLARTVGVDTVETVLLYHVVPGATVTYRQALKADGAKLPTAAGADLAVKVRGSQVRLRDADVDDRNPRVIRKLSNINKGNRQIAHGIDRVLRPADLP
jgi:uncharacterized surface protein with fasciclin (FAS1) repeats